jgi:S-adenosylmethionine decarboxylase
MMRSASLGNHCILELTGCPVDILSDEQRIREAIAKVSESSLSALLQLSSHKIPNQGVTALGLLAESHISIHTWPTLGYAAVDIFTSGDAARPSKACDLLCKVLRAEGHSMKVLPRGRRIGRAESPAQALQAKVAMA